MQANVFYFVRTSPNLLDAEVALNPLNLEERIAAKGELGVGTMRRPCLAALWAGQGFLKFVSRSHPNGPVVA
jgi:hypothetical protein